MAENELAVALEVCALPVLGKKHPTRLLVLDWVLVNWLMKVESTFGEELERVSRERLAVR